MFSFSTWVYRSDAVASRVHAYGWAIAPAMDLGSYASTGFRRTLKHPPQPVDGFEQRQGDIGVLLPLEVHPWCHALARDLPR